MLGRVFKPSRLIASLIGAGAALAMFSIASAQEADAAVIEDLITAIDSFWLLFAAIVVFLMQAGFAFLEAGLVRAKNTTNILMKNILDSAIGAIAFFAVGWAFAYGESGSSNDFIGLGNFFLADFDDYVGWFFNFAFAATAATIVSGAMAERTAFKAYLFYTVFISAFIYPVVVHWTWGGGWLAGTGTNGYLDFAGSGIVHMVGGFSGLMGALIVGPRMGKYGADGSIRAIPGHSITLAVFGMFILWFGWYGFNPGSTGGLTDGGAALAGKVALTTTLSAAGGCLMIVLLGKLKTGNFDAGLAINGVLGGLVGITAACAFVEPLPALLIGLVSGAIVMIGIEFLDKLHIDDPVGAVAVHGFAGLWGVIAVGLFATQGSLGDTDSYGLLAGGGVGQLGVQVLGGLAIMIWTMATSGILFLVIKFTIGLRASEAEEISGLDAPEHGINAYPEFERSPGYESSLV